MVVAGTLAVGSQVTGMDPWLTWTVGIVAGGGVAGLVQGGTILLRGLSLATTGGSQRVIELRRQKWTPDQDLEVLDERGYAMMGLRHENLAVVRVAAPGAVATAPIGRLVVLFDTSASRALGFAGQVKRLRELMQALPGAEHLPLQLFAFDQTVREVYSGKVGELDARVFASLIEGDAMGASDLQGALVEAIGIDLYRAALGGSSWVGADLRRSRLDDAACGGADLRAGRLADATGSPELAGALTDSLTWLGGPVPAWERPYHPKPFCSAGHSEPVSSVAFSADGRRCLTGSSQDSPGPLGRGLIRGKAARLSLTTRTVFARRHLRSFIITARTTERFRSRSAIRRCGPRSATGLTYRCVIRRSGCGLQMTEQWPAFP